jgi:HSP20 family protein
MTTMYLSQYRTPRAIRWYQPVGFNGGSRLPVDVHADPESFVITAAVPGLKAEDLKIEILDDVVTLSGKIKQEEPEAESYLLRELCLGEFSRSLRLPDPVDAGKAEAKVENGLLTLRLPKTEEARPKTIKVKAH